MGDKARTGADSYFKMNVATWLLLILGIITLATPALSSEPRVVCYYTNWSVYRPGTARFNPQNINPYLCTHLIYAFGGFTKDNTLKPFDKYQDIEKGGYAKFTGLKTYNKNLKTMLAIGGWNEGSTRFSPMVASRERRKEFVRNAIKFLRQNRFDGLDLDWEYPAFRDGGKPKDRENYARLVKELREEFERESEKTNKPRLLLTMAVPAGIEYIQKGFDVKTLNTYLDWMNLLTYDYHSAFEPAVNHHAPLYPIEEPNEYSVDTELNIDYTIKFYLESGADRDKLVLGIPTYGRSYTLFNADAVDIGSPADGPGEQGDATREKGYLAYYEICESLKPKTKKRSIDSEEDSEEYIDEEDEEWTIMKPNPNAMGPVAYKGNQWVGYDDVDIVRKKAEYVAENGLGGIMFWSIDNDDFRGNCHSKPYPLIEAAKETYLEKLGSAGNFLSVTEKPKAAGRPNRRRNKPKASTTSKPSAAKSSNKRKSSVTSTTPSWNVTPEPPTTPDPGSDFKCVDEGFYPHPRDCKKYFWCLDSGPSNLGIVAHQFTCPSGLFFNKAADSCDFARNVLCKIADVTTKAPVKTTRATTTVTTVSTTRKPIRLSTKNSVLFRSTTTTVAPEPEIEEEYVEENSFDEDAEDPRVIKELIDLIKKVGGVEQLEKQLHRAESASTDGGSSTTPSPFNKKLYQKVLERARGTNNRYTGNNVSQNSRRGPQSVGLETTQEKERTIAKDRSLNKDRPQYTTINRNRPSTSTTEEPLDSQEADQPERNQLPSRARAVESDSIGTTAKSLQYVNIRRARPTVTSDTADDTASRNALFERSESYVSVSEQPGSLDVASARRENQPEYVTIRRQRPTTEEATTIQYEEADSEVDVRETALEREISSQPQYTSIVRARATPTPSQEPITETKTTIPALEESSPEPTTVLAVQISSLLNSPNSAEETEASSAPETTAATEEVVTTTTPSTSAPSSTRRTILRRRGTTTTTPAPTSSTTQVSDRNYSFVRRRRPITQPNEIPNSDEAEGAGKGTSVERNRKIRSTTPDSREVDGVKDNRTVKRFRSRYLSTDDDSVPAAASVTRGQYSPRINSDELISLTPIDVEPQFVPRQTFNQRTERRFRGRTTVAVADSDASAATIDEKRPNIVPRGRSRFASRTTEASTSAPSTEATVNQRRPTFTRFSPRPFARASTTAPTEDNADDTIQSATQRILPRLPFGRTRPVSSTTETVVQARKLSFPSRVTTPQSLVSESDDDDEPENKNEDIFLSESAIEEKEHQEEDVDEEIPKRRVVVKKLRTPVTTEDSATESIPIDDSGKRKFRIIRKRPVSTSAPTETETPTEAPAPQRIRKVIRKKINRPIEEEPEIIAQTIGSLETLKITSTVEPTTEAVINYGERRRASTASTVSITTTPSTTTTEQVTENYIKEVSEDALEDVPEENSEEVLEEVKENVTVKEERKENDSDSEKTNDEIEITVTKEENIEIKNTEKDQSGDTEISNTENDTKPEVVVESEQKAIDLSENKEIPTTSEAQEPSPETTTTSTTTLTSTARSRIPYRPTKKIFTSTTESIPSSSRTFSRKFNPGVYTSPASVPTRAPPAFRPAGARRPAFGTQFRRPFTTARTTTRLEESEEEEYSDEELLEEEPENPFAFVPSSQLFTRKPDDEDDESNLEDDSEELLEDGEEPEPEEQEEEEEKDQNPFIATTKRPFRPKAVNSNTFRTSTSTTELPRRFGTQNKTAIYNRFGGNKPVNSTKKRVQNVPLGYTGPLEPQINATKTEIQEEQAKKDVTTNAPTTEYDTTTDDYLSMSDSPSTLIDLRNTDTSSTNTNTIDTETSTFQMEISTDDYLENTEQTTYYPTTQDGTTNAQTTNSQNTVTNTEAVTEKTQEPTTLTPTTNAPIIKTQYNKLFSVSRVVEVSSKLDKHRLNKNNVTTLIEEGQVMVEKKPVVDKIGEVSRFSFIKIVEDDIPIYLTKYGHIYPVDNPPDNLIRIDEARNARALTSYAELPRENLVASESINEAYRHVKKVSDLTKKRDTTESDVERIPSDGFLSYINEDKKSEAMQEDPLFAQWQFVPAAYENEQSNLNKAAKTFEVVTPRSMRTHPSTLSLEGLFPTGMPITARKVSEDKNQPFVVYSAPVSQKEDINIVKLEVLKPETGRSITTFAKGHEIFGESTLEKDSTKSPISVSILPKTDSTTTISSTTVSTTERMIPSTEGMKTSPIVEMLSTTQTTITEPTTTDEPTTTETIPDETTIATISPLEAKRAKYGFPRRPIMKSSNSTRFNVPRIISKKANTTVLGNLIKKTNKTSTFTPTKSRFVGARAQNVPVDIRKKINNRLTTRVYTTETPRTTTERKLYFKPIRSTFRPAFVPRKTTFSQASEES